MNKKHDTFPLLTNLNRISIVVYFVSVKAKVDWIRAVLRPLYCLIIDKLVFELPVFESYLLTIFICHILALHIPGNLPKNDFVSSWFLGIVGLRFDFKNLLQDKIFVRIMIIRQQSLRLEHTFLLVLNPHLGFFDHFSEKSQAVYRIILALLVLILQSRLVIMIFKFLLFVHNHLVALKCSLPLHFVFHRNCWIVLEVSCLIHELRLCISLSLKILLFHVFLHIDLPER